MSPANRSPNIARLEPVRRRAQTVLSAASLVISITFTMAALAATTSACASFSTMGSARVLDPGKMRVAPSITVGGAETDQKADIETVQPQLELGASIGVIEDFELGLRIWTLPSKEFYTVGGQLSAKLQLYRPIDPTSGVHISIAPRLSYHRVGTPDAGVNAVAIGVPLLIGITFGDMNELVLGPQIGGQLLSMDGGSDIYAVTVGSSVGAVLWVSECFALVPEVSVHWSSLTAENDDQIWFWQAGIGVLFDIGL